MHPFTSAFLVAAISASQSVAQTTSPSSSSNSSAAANSSSAGGGGAMSLVSGLSTSCQVAATGLITSQFGSCANIIGLVSVIGAQGSVVPPLTSWITSVCASSPCSDSTLSSAQSSVNSGCGDDISKGNSAAVSLSTIVTNYKPIRNLLCTQYTSNGTFCVPAVLNNVQTDTGKNITLPEIQGLLTQGSGALSTLVSSAPPSAYCTDCGKAIFVESESIKPAGTSSNSTAASGYLSDKCGASFNDGQLPSSVRVATNGAASSAQNSAAQLDVPRQVLTLALAGLMASLLL